MAVQETAFKKANAQDMRLLFTYLEFCLEQIVKDNELGALRQGLNGGYVEPGPGGDPIRNPKVCCPLLVSTCLHPLCFRIVSSCQLWCVRG